MDAATVTIIFIILSALVAVVLRKIKKDKCLKDFREDIVTLELLNGQQYRGEMKMKSSGLQFNYPKLIEGEYNLKFLSFLLRVGCRSLRSAFASIWRTRSRVTAKSLPTSSRV